jgi:dTDP-glucose 4,6-dehydratase
VSVRDLADLVLSLSGSSSPLAFVERPVHDHDHRLPDTSRAERELGWVRHVSLEAGLRQTIQDFRGRLGRLQVSGGACPRQP